MSEVFLTGLGLVSPFGVGSHPFFDGLAAGATGAHRPLLQLEGSPLEGQEVGWVPGLEEALGTLPAKLRKFMSEAAILGCLAGREAWDQAALGGRVDPEQVGIYAATGLTAANYESSRELLSSCIDPGGEFSEALLGSRGLASMNPLDSFRILPNMPPCMLAILLGIRGPSLVFNPFEDQGAAALVEAVLAVAQGDVEAALVGAADTPSAPSSLVYLRQSGLLREDEIPSPGAAYFVLESRSSASTLAKITVRPSGTWVDVCGPRMGRAYAAAPALALAAALPAVLAGQQVDVTLPRSFIAIGVPTMTRRVAISGIGVICALGQDPAAFWGEAALGRSGIAPISHFDAGTFEAQLGAEIRGLPELPEELRTWLREDPKVVFGLLAARQALRDAGLEKLPESALLHAGTSLEYFDPRKIVQDGLADFLATVQRCFQPGARPLQVPLDTFTRLLRPGPGRSLVNVSACAASTQAIGHAFRQVRSGATDLALCGGFDSMLNPFGVGGFQLLGALSADMARGARACRPFDAARAGTVLGEGAAFLVIEDLDRVKAEGRPIYGEVLGYGSSLDAYKLSAPDPQGLGARRAMALALEDAGLRVEEVDAVSAHATGTLLNDEVEASAIRAVLGDHWNAVPVVATKSLIGHLIGAAGAVEVVALLQGFAEGRLHPNGSLERVAPGCELNHVVGEARAFGGRVILKNSFGFGGQNACLAIGRVP